MYGMGRLAISLTCAMSEGNYTTSKIVDSSTEDAVDKKHFTHAHTHIFSPTQPGIFPLLRAKCKCFPGIKVYKCH